MLNTIYNLVFPKVWIFIAIKNIIQYKYSIKDHTFQTMCFSETYLLFFVYIFLLLVVTLRKLFSCKVNRLKSDINTMTVDLTFTLLIIHLFSHTYILNNITYIFEYIERKKDPHNILEYWYDITKTSRKQYDAKMKFQIYTDSRKNGNNIN